MTQFLTTTGISHNLEQLIKDAKEKLILISPYLKINERLRQLLEDKDREKMDIRVVYGKNELQLEENIWLRSKTSIRSSFCKNLHAKCFLNESAALLTSMNLYEFSQVNNEEMGILISKVDDAALYAKVYEEAMRLIRISEEIRVTVEKGPPPAPKPPVINHPPAKTLAPAKGLCIRKGEEIKADPTRPYCKECYDIWKAYDNPDYEEAFCHLCGKPNKSTMRKPTCYDCYRKYRDVFSFPLSSIQ